MQQYAGIVIDQNAIATGAIDWRGTYDSQTVYQTFYLPSDYAVGTNLNELRYPDLAGFQVMVNVDAGYATTASLDCTLDVAVGSGWSNLAAGTVIGAPVDGTGWFDVLFPKTITVDETLTSSLLRLGITTRSTAGEGLGVLLEQIDTNTYLMGTIEDYSSGSGDYGSGSYGSLEITATLTEGIPFPVIISGKPGFLLLQDTEVTFASQQGVGGLWYTSPNPLGTSGQAYQSDGITPLLTSDTDFYTGDVYGLGLYGYEGTMSASINFRILGLIGDSGTDFLQNPYRSCVVSSTGTETSTTNPSWISSPMPSPFAVCSQYFDVTNDGASVVIDGVLIDPATPNMAFNVYYSTDDSYNNSNMTERDWEQKLWTRVPQVYTATQRQEYVFPQPISASYVKIEYTNLQAQTYDPGNFQQPVGYKKFPTWVADFFIAQLESVSFIANQVNVVNDALTFAYDYYLDDLSQTPQEPVSAPSSQIPALTSYFSQSDAQGLVDASTLAQINLTMQQFQIPTGGLLQPTSLLSQYAVQTLSSTPATGTSETPTATTPLNIAVSGSQREPVVFEQSLPVMYFWLPCRHTYKQLNATFDYNRAYFASINDVQFLRHNYATESDTDTYIESAGDTYNTMHNDFTVGSDGNWYV